MSTAYVRRPLETNPNLVTCCCAKCGVLVAASESYALMAVMEALHKCAPVEGRKPPTKTKH
jgi:hypothetical protein